MVAVEGKGKVLPTHLLPTRCSLGGLALLPRGAWRQSATALWLPGRLLCSYLVFCITAFCMTDKKALWEERMEASGRVRNDAEKP